MVVITIRLIVPSGSLYAHLNAFLKIQPLTPCQPVNEGGVVNFVQRIEQFLRTSKRQGGEAKPLSIYE